MNEEPPTPFDTVGDEPVEARIVAWVLGESSGFEAAELERLCAERPELLVFRRRMRALHGLLTEAEASGPDLSWKLPSQKREVLDVKFGQVKAIAPDPLKDQRIRRSGRRAFLAIAACLILTIVVAGVFSAGSGDVRRARKMVQGRANASAFTRESNIENLDVAIRNQEAKVEERRKVLATIVRTKGIIYKGQNSFGGQSGVDEDQGASGLSEIAKDDNREESIKRGLDAQDYADAKREFEADETLLQSMKLKQIDGLITGKMTDDSVVVQEMTPPLASLRSMSEARQREVAAGKSQIASEQKTEEMNRSGGDFISPVNGTSVDGIPADPNQFALSDVTNGLRSSEQEITRNNIDATLQNPNRGAQPALPDVAQSRFGDVAGPVASTAAVPDAATDGALPPPPPPPPQASPRGSLEFEEQLVSEAPQSDAESPATTIVAPEKGMGIALELKAGSAQHQSNASELAAGFGTTADYGLRSADKAVDRNSIDAILNQPARPAEASKSKGTKLSSKSEVASTPTLSQDRSLKPLDADASDDKRSWNFYGGMKQRSSEELAEEKIPVLKDLAVVGGELEKQLAMPRLAWSGSGTGTGSGSFLEKGRISPAGLQPAAAADPFISEPLGEPAPPIAPPDEPESMEEIAAAEIPYSTFSLNISDASFQLAKAALAKGERPDPASIKPEQFYNAVDYGDPAPSANEPVAAIIEQSAHPVIPGRNLVRVAIRTGSAGRSAAQPLRLTLLVDQSGSMVREDRRASMEHALSQLAVLLTKADLVTVIGFSRTPHLLAEGWTGDQAGKLGGLVNQTASEGGTNLEEALKLGAQKAAAQQLAGAQNRIVLFTDGAANLGDANPARLAAQVKSLRQKNIAFDVAGIGADGLNDRLLSELARNGNGRYYVVGSEADDSFARQLAGAFRPAAENVKVQVNFNPLRVGKYKLIGFEKDRLTTEDFRNDAVDAAELAAEEAGVAVYQVEPLTAGGGEIGEVSVRFRDAAGGEMVERAWTIPYEAQAAAFDRATPSMQLAGLALLAAEKLKGGPLGEAIDFNRLTGSSAFVKQFYGGSARVAEMLRMIDALK